MDQLRALSVLDGRYASLTNGLNEIFSEYGLIKHRLYVELQWLQFLGQELSLFKLSASDIKRIERIFTNFNFEAARRIKTIEATTNHDVKAVEYYIKEVLNTTGISHIEEWTHFACTSEDINNTAYALMIRQGRDLALNIVGDMLEIIEKLARDYQHIPMMARTHGQPATPTTAGKEFVNFAWRLRREQEKLASAAIEAKMNGASGNLNAHYLVFPNIDWISASQTFIKKYLQATPLLFTTQINPYSYIAELLQILIRISTVLIDFDRDMWGYISLGYFKQKLKKGEVGSSTMPHKVNPIDFENSEGNLGIAISLMEHLSTKLLISRFQRDLSDSTVLRNLGAVFGYFLIGVQNGLKGVKKIDINQPEIFKDLQQNAELLAEPIQTVMRVFGEDQPYEKLKELTRGKHVSNKELAEFIESLRAVPQEFKDRLKNLTCDQYIGVADKLVDFYFNNR